jgi:hypothetical protein
MTRLVVALRFDKAPEKTNVKNFTVLFLILIPQFYENLSWGDTGFDVMR